MNARRLRSIAAGFGLAATLVAAVGLPSGAEPAGTVDARDYRAFWLWAGVRPQPALEQAERLYLLAGEVEAVASGRLLSRRPSLPHLGAADVWMVVRADTLDWPPRTIVQLLDMLERWRTAGNRLVGLQIDFDAGTRRLAGYADFLRMLRRRLPTRYRLGITGLLDWSANGDPRGLDLLAGTVDEVVLQIYQGRHVIPGYDGYFAKLDRMRLPFRIGLLQGGEWRPPPALLTNPWFRGYVVFLRNA